MPNEVIGIDGNERCFHCQSTRLNYKPKLIKSGRQEFWYPKYIPQIKESCGDCGRFIKFTKQEDWLIDRINEQFTEVKV